MLKELADECHRQGVRLHFYYSHIDWTREDYPQGRTGHDTGRDSTKVDWPGYYDFMNAQLTELLTNYGEIGAIWFDGWWDHDEDTVPFDWQLDEQYALIHRLQPSRTFRYLSVTFRARTPPDCRVRRCRGCHLKRVRP